MILQVILFVFVGSVLAKDPSHGGWKQISVAVPVCVKPRDDGYGHLSYHGESKLVSALKLKYVSGDIRCKSNEVYNSRWGCAEQTKYPLNIIVTDASNHVIFPLPEFIKNKAAGMWYYMPLVDAEWSDELVFADFGHPFYLKEGDKLRFWYGEDLMKYADKDNQGQVCFQVLALFV
ncbi:hypothetical protein ACROYT_G004558 [Oculina patagonica]